MAALPVVHGVGLLNHALLFVEFFGAWVQRDQHAFECRLEANGLALGMAFIKQATGFLAP